MREIIFKGKIANTDEWVEGYYVCLNGKEHRIYDGYAETDCEDYFPDWFTVDPKTIGQYTGLKDKNGKRIYDEDIVKCEFTNVFGECFETDVIVNLDDHRLMCDIEHSSFLEIVGNIHDNPEKMKVES